MTVIPDTLQRCAEAILPVLVDSAIKGAVLLGAAALAVAAMRKTSAAARQAVWALALAGLLALPLLAGALPSVQVLPAWAKVDIPPPQAAPEQPAPLPTPAAGPALTQATDRSRSLPPEEERPAPWAAVSPEERPIAVAEPLPSPAERPAPTEPTPREERAARWPAVLAWATAAWAAGAALCLLPLILGRLSLWRLGRSARTVTDGSWAILVRRAAEAVGLRGPVRMLLSDKEPMPMLWGVFRPRLLIPAEARDWSADRRWVVLLHELAHARRLDCLAKAVAHFACALYWFNPLAWVAFRLMQREAEAACDDLVLSGGHRPSDYAQHLLEIASGLKSGMLAAYSSIAMARKSKLEGRLLAILDPRRSRRRLTFFAVALAAILLAGLTVPLAMLQARDGRDSQAESNNLPATQPAADANEIQRLIRQLGGETFAERDAAETALVRIGLPAVAALERAAKDSDAERGSRAGRAVIKIKTAAGISLLTVAGRVLDEETRSPIRRFTVYAFGLAARPEWAGGKQFEANDGRFVLDDLPAKTESASLEIWIASEGRPTCVVGEVSPEEPSPATVKDFRLPKAKQLRGRLLDEATGEPLAGVPVSSALIRRAPLGYRVNWAAWAQPAPDLADLTRVVTDKDGGFTLFEQDAAGRGADFLHSNSACRALRTLFIQVPGYEKVCITPDGRRGYPTEANTLHIALARGGSVSGTYGIAGRPRPDARLRLRGPRAEYGETRTDGNGHFAWNDLPASILDIQGPFFDYRLELAKAEKRVIDLDKEFGILTLAGRASREGKALAAQDQIYLEPAFDWAFRILVGRTDEEGNFRIEGLRAGKYRAYPGYPPSGANPGPNRYGPEIIEIKADTRQDLDFAPAAPSAPGTPEPAADAAEIERLIQQLGSEKLAERDAAQEALIEIGPPAVKALEAAIADKDIERAVRAGQALRVILAGYRTDAVWDVLPQRLPSVIRWLTLKGPAITDASLERLKGARLESLMLYQTAVTDEGLAHLSQVAGLKKLYLRTPGIKGPGLAHLKHLRGLESLEVLGAVVGEEALAHVGEAEGLRELSIAYMRLTATGLGHLGKMKNLRRLNLYGCGVTDRDLAQLEAMKDLEALDLTHSSVTDAGLARLKAMNGLRELRIGRSPVGPGGITDHGLAHLAALKDLEELDLMGHGYVTDDGMKHVVALKGLKSLGLHGTSVSGQPLKHMPQLERLALSSSQALVGQEHLRAMKKLSQLVVFGAINLEDMKWLKRLVGPTCAVEFHGQHRGGDPKGVETPATQPATQRAGDLRVNRAKAAAARTDIASLAVALATFEIDVGRWPAAAEGLGALVQQPAGIQGWRGPYIRNVPEDPWGRPYVYRFPGQHNKHGFDLYSLGPDGKEGTDDDVTNWPRPGLGEGDAAAPGPTPTQPATQPATQPERASFGPVVERVLPNDAEHHGAIDFETGTVHEWSQAWLRTSRTGRIRAEDEWMKDNRIAASVGGAKGLVGHAMAVKDLKAAFQDVTPQAVVDAVQGLDYATHGLPPADGPVNFPLVMAFKTHYGAMGVLEIVGRTDNPKGVRIRYRLVRDAIIRAELDLGAAGGKCHLDLDSSYTYSAPGALRDEAARARWREYLGIDLWCDIRNVSPAPVLVCLGLKAVEAKGVRLEEMTIIKAQDLLRQADVGERFLLKPSTYVFRTREGALGVLEVIGLNSQNRPNATLRYRLLPEGHPAPRPDRRRETGNE